MWRSFGLLACRYMSSTKCPESHPIRLWITDPSNVLSCSKFHEAQELYQKKEQDSSSIPLNERIMPYVPIQVTQELYDSIEQVEQVETFQEEEDLITHYDYFFNGKNSTSFQLIGKHMTDSGLICITKELPPTEPIDWETFYLHLQESSFSHDRDLFPQFLFLTKTGYGDIFPISILAHLHCPTCNLVSRLCIKT
jgi:hypothetical protein